MKMYMQLLLRLWLIVVLLWTAAAADECRRECGNVAVPYPFGMGQPNCSMNSWFNLTCNDTLNPPVPYIFEEEPVLNISVEEATVRLEIWTLYDCYNQSGPTKNSGLTMNLTETPFTLSATQNKFTAIGCDTWALMAGSKGERYGSGCMSLCNSPVNLTAEASCSGIGCCQTQIPEGLQLLNISLDSFNNHSDTLDFNPCSYAYLAAEDWLDFSKIDMKSYYPEKMEKPPLVLDWVVENKTCESAFKNQSSYACGPNSDCLYYSDNYGYRCKCKEGYRGNPYLHDDKGCQDIDECSDPTKYHCEGTCKNTPGNYTCRCPLGMKGDGKMGCRGLRLTLLAKVIAGTLLSVIVVFCAFWAFEKRSREKYFRKNGGLFLMNQRVKIFSAVELKKATNNYSQLLGQGASGAVYKGTLTNNIEVAVKKSKEVDKSQIEQFLDEVRLVSQVNHKNVVKLLGLCLETSVPLLVYEFVSNGTLFKHIHEEGSTIINSWQNRLKIAAEIAQALEYLHSLADPPIIHRDIKSMNILLDGKYTAKVSDFGASVLIPSDQTGVATRVMGSWGYMDPEYLQTGDLTTKSDVYSFGVVLMELLTGIKPWSNEKRNMIQYFISSYEENRLTHILNVGDIDQNNMEQIKVVAKITYKCLKRSGWERPTMKEVADELIGLMHEYLGAHERNEETECLLGEPRSHTGQSSSVTQFMRTLNIEL